MLKETNIMADITSELAARCGISPEQAQKGMGAVLGFLKTSLPAETYSKLSSAVPGADGMVAQAGETAPETSGGVLSAVTGAIGKLFGGSGGELASRLSGSNFSVDQVKKFLPAVLEFLKGKLPDNLYQQVSSKLSIS
jgi:hypothetical protein